jgi:Bacterial SCP ortholog
LARYGLVVVARRVDPQWAESVTAVAKALDAGQEPAGEQLRIAVRYLLGTLAERVPGKAVEVRVPPVAAVQCIQGPGHTRGTPPNVVETDPVTWVRLATGRLGWAEAVGAGTVRASGPRADLSAYLPVALRCDSRRRCGKRGATIRPGS